MSTREEFVILASVEGANVRELRRRFGVSPRSGYKWISRYREEGREGLSDQSRRPRDSPSATSREMVELIVALRRKHPAWGGRKLKRRLEDLRHVSVPAVSTITGILRRENLLDGPGVGVSALQRFEHPFANDLWQMELTSSLSRAFIGFAFWRKIERVTGSSPIRLLRPPRTRSTSVAFGVRSG